MTEKEIKEYVTEIRHKADIFRNSGFATAGVATVFDKSADIIEELLKYKAIGTVEELKALKEKSVAKKVISRNSMYRCPTCESLVSVTQTKCTKCNQKLDWE